MNNVYILTWNNLPEQNCIVHSRFVGTTLKQLETGHSNRALNDFSRFVLLGALRLLNELVYFLLGEPDEQEKTVLWAHPHVFRVGNTPTRVL